VQDFLNNSAPPGFEAAFAALPPHERPYARGLQALQSTAEHADLLCIGNVNAFQHHYDAAGAFSLCADINALMMALTRVRSHRWRTGAAGGGVAAANRGRRRAAVSQCVCARRCL